MATISREGQPIQRATLSRDPEKVLCVVNLHTSSMAEIWGTSNKPTPMLNQVARR